MHKSLNTKKTVESDDDVTFTARESILAGVATISRFAARVATISAAFIIQINPFFSSMKTVHLNVLVIKE
jgi:hypothetical protein